jgi:pilus assembly protein Flp/PilA
MKNLFVRFVREDAGQDLIEYALLAALVALAAGAGAASLGTKLNGWYTAVGTTVNGWATSTGS